MPDLLIGCSGFNYKHWKGIFYPDHVPQRKWLDFYAEHFRTVELNVTFYRLPRESSFDHWYEVTPPDFRFAVKGSRYITHIKRLIDPKGALEKFFPGPLRLKDKLSVVLWQFPPSFPLDLGRLKHFLDLSARWNVRQALEFRHESWICEEVIALCRDLNVSLCLAEWPPFNFDLPLTADFVYIRRHGHGGDHYGRFPLDFVKADSEKVASFIRNGRDVFFYYNNDAGGSALANAQELDGVLADSLHVRQSMK